MGRRPRHLHPVGIVDHPRRHQHPRADVARLDRPAAQRAQEQRRWTSRWTRLVETRPDHPRPAQPRRPRSPRETRRARRRPRSRRRGQDHPARQEGRRQREHRLPRPRCRQSLHRRLEAAPQRRGLQRRRPRSPHTRRRRGFHRGRGGLFITGRNNLRAGHPRQVSRRVPPLARQRVRPRRPGRHPRHRGSRTSRR